MTLFPYTTLFRSVTQAALLGADIATVPMAALKKCLHHPLTDQGLASFEADWKKVVEAQ